jgi:hypothetical protein
MAYVRRLHAVKPLVVERDALIAKLALVAPGWAEQITQRVPPHDHAGTIPGDLAMAWTWRQLHDTLARARQARCCMTCSDRSTGRAKRFVR